MFYVHIAAFGRGGVYVSVNMKITVENKRPMGDYEHIKNPSILSLDSVPIGNSRTISKILALLGFPLYTKYN